MGLRAGLRCSPTGQQRFSQQHERAAQGLPARRLPKATRRSAGQGTKPNIRDEKGGEWLYSPSRCCLQRSPMENRISQPEFYPILASFCPPFTKQQRIQLSRQGSQ